VALGRRLVLRLLAAHRSLLINRAAELAGADVVVGAAVVRDGRLLVARRSRPAELAGRWELPGGQVEPGESDVDALVRECKEELGVTITVGDRVGPDLPLGRRVLRVYAASLPVGEPRAIEHAELRWVRAADLAELDWLSADRAVLPELAALLRRSWGRRA
jgi:8-oxo-dGTP diphosphatase